MDHQSVDTAQPPQGLGQRNDPAFVEHADQLVTGAGRVGQRPEQVEDRADADLAARADRVAHGTVKRRGEEKAEPHLTQAVLDLRG